MEIYGKGEEVWEVDEGLRNTAAQLLARFPDELGHIVLDQVIFMRANGVKLSKTAPNWYGKCWLIKIPLKIMPRFTLLRLSHAGLIDAEAAAEVLGGVLDPAYIVAVNNEAIEEEGGPIDKIEEVTLHHELLHISEDMDKLVQHDVKDFRSILQQYGLYWTQGVFEEPDTKQEPAFLDNFITKLSKGPQKTEGVEESD
jgi:hypothetical protein